MNRVFHLPKWRLVSAFLRVGRRWLYSQVRLLDAGEPWGASSRKRHARWIKLMETKRLMLSVQKVSKRGGAGPPRP